MGHYTKIFVFGLNIIIQNVCMLNTVERSFPVQVFICLFTQGQMIFSMLYYL
jgi:hypothetical protein